MGGLILAVGLGLFIAAVVAPTILVVALPIAVLSSRGRSRTAIVRRHQRVQLAALVALGAGGLAVIWITVAVGVR
jgi:hypothetical protein